MFICFTSCSFEKFIDFNEAIKMHDQGNSPPSAGTYNIDITKHLKL